MLVRCLRPAPPPLFSAFFHFAHHNCQQHLALSALSDETTPLRPCLRRPAATDLAAAIKAQSVLIARDAGGDSFDDACLHPHINVREAFPEMPFPEVLTKNPPAFAALVSPFSARQFMCVHSWRADRK